ncbi:MAG: ATP/GTP-binding protein [Paludibacteraceae bacterium]
MSFADECDFTMLANKDDSHAEDLVSFGKDRISKARLIYGANASGKTSFINAMYFVSSFMANSNLMLEKMPIPVAPFKFCKDCFNAPSEFSITFIKDGLKYAYKFSCTREKVIDERLDIYYTAKPTMIFNRTNTNNYEFNKDAKILNVLKERNLDNKLFLVTSASWNYEKTKPVVDYLLNTITVMNIDVLWSLYLDRIYANNEQEEYKAFCLKILNNADISISDFKVDSKKIKDVNAGDLFTKLLTVAADGNEEAVKTIQDTNVYSFTTYHDVKEEDGSNRYGLLLDEESFGTINMFKYSAVLYYVFKEGKVLFVDEIDKSLHPLMVEYLIKMFHDKSINTTNAQLVANTHDTNLLDLDIFRRDDIWFTERNYTNGKTEMYSLADFSPRKTENIEKAYLLGRFGAIPFIKGE